MTDAESGDRIDSIDDVFVPENMEWGALIRCTECGAGGPMYSTHEPDPDRQYWDCKECGNGYTKHDMVLKTDSVEKLRDGLLKHQNHE